MPDQDITRGGIRVELTSDQGSSKPENNGSKVFIIPNNDRKKIKTIDDLALSDITLSQFPHVKEWRDRLFKEEGMPEICDELPRLLTEYMQNPEANDLSPQTRRANALHHVFSNKKPFVKKDDLLPINY